MHKNIAIEFLKAAASGNAREAFVTYATTDFVHHNAYFEPDAMSLAIGMEDNSRQFPEKSLEVRHAIEEGDLVAVHSEVHHTPGDRGVAVVHIFRFSGDRIAELWDVAQEVPAAMANRSGMF
jgi:predicted SnoaL-like aldol condensation-catalyzing enzyme